jgi:hypothetical protein
VGNSYVTCSLCDNGIGGIFTAVPITTCVLQALSKQQKKYNFIWNSFILSIRCKLCSQTLSILVVVGHNPTTTKVMGTSPNTTISRLLKREHHKLYPQKNTQIIFLGELFSGLVWSFPDPLPSSIVPLQRFQSDC